MTQARRCANLPDHRVPRRYGFSVVEISASIRAQAQVLVPSSLQRRAQREYRRLIRGNFLALGIRALSEQWAAIPSLARATILPLAVILSAVGGLFLPCPIHWSALSNAKAAASFVAQAWAVTGASVGFSLVLIVFAFQMVATMRPSTSIRELATVTPLLFVLYLDVAALLVDGLVLLHVGHQAPAKWAASWATDISGLAIFSLAFLIAASLRAVDPQFLQRRRIIQVRKRTTAAINAEAIQRLTLSLLMQDSQKFGYEFSPLTSAGPVRDSESVRASRTGIVVDIRLDRLRRVARQCASSQLPKPVVTAFPGRTVVNGTRLVVIPRQLDATCRRRLKTAFKTKRDITSDARSLLEAAADQLHQEAIQAIRNGLALAFQDARQAQEELLLAFPEAWAQLGQFFTAELASGVFPLTFGPLDTVGQHLYEQTMQSVASGDQRMASDSAGMVLTVASRAPALGAHGLSDRMLSVLSAIVSATSGSSPGSVGQQVYDSVRGHVISYIEYVVFPCIENGELSEVDRHGAVTFLSEAFRILTDMMKNAVDRGDLKFFDEAASSARNLGNTWLSEHGYPVGDNDADYNVACAARNVLDRFRFALCAWQVRSLWIAPRNEASIHAFTTLAWFDDPYRLLDVAEMPFGDPASRLLSDWVLWSQPIGEAHLIDTRTPIFRTFALVAVKYGFGPNLDLRPSQWILDNAGQLEVVIAEIESAADLTTAASIDNVAATADALRVAVRQAAAQKEAALEEQLINASVDDARVKAFASKSTASWGSRRFAVELLRRAGAFEEIDGTNRDARFGYRQHCLKDWFVSDRIGSLDGLAERVGNVIATGEDAKLWQAVARARPLRRVTGDINRRLDNAIEVMRQSGYEPTVAFVPWRTWQLPPELELQPLEHQADGAGAKDRTLGRFRELLVVRALDQTGDRVTLADLRAFAVFRQWSDSDEVLVTVVTAYDEQTALAAVRADRRLMHAPGRTRLADRARELRKLVLVEVFEELTLAITDTKAARAVMLPPGLIRPSRQLH